MAFRHQMQSEFGVKIVTNPILNSAWKTRKWNQNTTLGDMYQYRTIVFAIIFLTGGGIDTTNYAFLANKEMRAKAVVLNE